MFARRPSVHLLVTLALVFALCPADVVSDLPAAQAARPVLSQAVFPAKPHLVTDPTRTYSYRRLLRELDQLASMYPNLIELSTLGKTVAGLSIPLVKLGSGAREVLVLGAEHAREHVTTNFIMRTIDTYALAATKQRQVAGVDVAKALRCITFYFVPQLNVDGVALATGQANARQRKLASRAVGAQHLASWRHLWKANARGVDLNRNYPTNWRHGKTSPNNRPAFEGYKGSAPASEPEVQAVIKLAKAHHFASLLAIHTSGEIVYYRDTYTPALPGARALAQRVCNIMGYRFASVGRLDPGHSDNGAASADWFRHTFRKPALTIELTPPGQSYAEAPKRFNQQIWPRGKGLLLRLWPS